MKLQQWLNSAYFLEKNQFEKRELLKGSILTDNYCNIGNNVTCFDTEPYCSKMNERFYSKSSNKSCDLTIGKSYEILDHRKGKIKISNDSNKIVYVTIHRFMYSIKYERKEKLININNSEENILNDTTNKKLICVLCGQEWGNINKFTNTCENENCRGFCTWGYEPMKPESFDINENNFWILKTIPKNINDL